MKSRVVIIAEAGVNHNGSIEMAEHLIDAAANAGADFVKFQTFKTELNIAKGARKADYQIENTKNSEETQFEMVKKLELSFDDFKHLKEYCSTKGIEFLSTGFDISSIDFLDNIGQSFFKIPSGEITNKPYLLHVAGKGKPVILSTGMSEMEEINEAINLLIDGGLKREMITVLHCNTGYPTPFEDVNLKAMLTIKHDFGVNVGYSDHTQGIEVPIAAVALGAEVIEKHFTLDRKLPGPDHKASLEPGELEAMTKAIRNVELALQGDGIKRPSPSEIPNIIAARKSIHLARPIKAGEVITQNHLAMKRPGDGISPMDIDKVVGRKCKINIDTDTKLLWEWIGE